MELLTESFSKENFIGNVKLGKVYWGKTEQGQEVIVKIWFSFDSQNIDLASHHANYSLTRLEVPTTKHYISFICLLLQKVFFFFFFW